MAAGRCAARERRCRLASAVHTVQAGSEEDVGQAAGSAQAAADSNESLSSFLVCLVEAPDPPQGAMAETPMALVAIDTSTGSVLYDDFRCVPAWLQPAGSMSMCTSHLLCSGCPRAPLSQGALPASAHSVHSLCMDLQAQGTPPQLLSMCTTGTGP